MSEHHHEQPQAGAIRRPAPNQASNQVAGAALWASAFVLLAMIVTQAGKIGPVAMAGNVSTVNDLTVLTASGGDGQDNLIMLDRRSERVFVYGVELQNGVRLLESYDLKEVFQNARNASGGAMNTRP